MTRGIQPSRCMCMGRKMEMGTQWRRGGSKKEKKEKEKETRGLSKSRKGSCNVYIW